jgi:hypothetical protein
LDGIVNGNSLEFFCTRLRRHLVFGAHPALAVAIDFAARLAMNVAAIVESAVVLCNNFG